VTNLQDEIVVEHVVWIFKIKGIVQRGNL